MAMFTTVLKLCFGCVTVVFTAVITLLQQFFATVLQLYGHTATVFTAIIIGLLRLLRHCLWLCYSCVTVIMLVLWLFYRYGYSYVLTLSTLLQKCLRLCYDFECLIFIAVLHQHYSKLTADLLVSPQQILFTKCYCIVSKC